MTPSIVAVYNKSLWYAISLQFDSPGIMVQFSSPDLMNARLSSGM